MASRVIDLTLSLSGKTPTFPGDISPSIKRVSSLEKDAVVGSVFTLSTHHGTHLDAPSHFIAHGKPLSHYPLERFAGLPGVLIDARDGKTIDETILEGVTLPKGGAVLFFTGYTDSHPVEFRIEDAPALTPRIARELVKAEVGLVGIDSFSVDFDPYDVHKILLAGDVLLNETLTNLAPLAHDVDTGKTFRHFALPLKLEDTDGSPCRAFAEVQ